MDHAEFVAQAKDHVVDTCAYWLKPRQNFMVTCLTQLNCKRKAQFLQWWQNTICVENDARAHLL